MAMRENLLINYSRKNCDSIQTDNLKFKGDSLIVRNYDPINKNIEIELVSEENNNYRTYNLSNLSLSQNDSLISEINSSNDFIISNPGPIKNYDLRIEYQNSEKEDIFLNQQVALSSNTSHKIIPQWDSLTLSPVIILVDVGNNGTIDDSLYLQNQLFNFQINNAWNLLSLPLFPQDSSVTSLFPFALTKAFSYQLTGYTQNDFMSPGIGYWLKFGVNQNVEVIGETLLFDTISVRQGWNLVGTISKPLSVMSVETIPPNNINSPFYGFEGSYTQSDTLKPGKGYWVKCSQAGVIILSSGSSALKKPLQNSLDLLSSFASIKVSDISGVSQSLFVTSSEVENIDYYELPPIPPAGIFDARFTTGRMLEVVKKGEKREIPISVSSAIYPITISWDIIDENFAAILRAGNEGYSMAGSGSVTLTNPNDKLFLLINTESASPEKFALEQNYPNPFNSNTIIKFSIAKEVQVNLSVYNILGEKVSELKDEVMKPGRYDT